MTSDGDRAPSEQGSPSPEQGSPSPEQGSLSPDRASAAPDRDSAGRHPRSGDPAPGFSLDGTGGRRYSLADYLGEPVVLVFYPADHSPVCTQQLRSYSEDLGPLSSLGAHVLCLSPQDVATHEAFVAANNLRLPLLADVGKAVGRAYDILGPLGFYRRSIFVVDAGGIVRFARRSLTSMTYMPAPQLIDAVRAATPA